MAFLERLAGAQWIDKILSTGAAPADGLGAAGSGQGLWGQARERAQDVGLAAVPRRAIAGGEGRDEG